MPGGAQNDCVITVMLECVVLGFGGLYFLFLKKISIS